MARNDPQVNLRMPAELKDRLDAAADGNSRSLTAEIVDRLRDSFDWPTLREALRRDREFFESKLREANLELAACERMLEQQKTVSRQLQDLINDSAEKAHQEQDAADAIDKRFAELKEQYDLLEGVKEELAHLSHARGDNSAQTEALLKQQSELIEQLRINQTLSEQTINVFREAFLDAASGDETAFERLIAASRQIKKP